MVACTLSVSIDLIEIATWCQKWDTGGSSSADSEFRWRNIKSHPWSNFASTSQTMRRRFERFRQASGLADKSEEHQVNTLVYTMGDEADDILRSQGLTNEEKMTYEIVKKELEKYFVKRHNPNYERAKFNQNRRVS